MTQEEKYAEILKIVYPMIPSEFTGIKRRNIKSNIKLYVQRLLGLKEAKSAEVFVHRTIRDKVDELLKNYS